MAFDMTTARPIEQPIKKGFDISTATPLDQPVAQQPEAQPVEKIGAGSAMWEGIKRGAEKTALGVTQRVLEYVSDRHKNQIDDFASKMQSGEIPATEENINKLDAMQSQALIEAKAKMLGSEYEASAREKFSPIQKDRPVASFVGDVAGQMAALPIPALRTAATWAGLGTQMVKGGAEGYAQAAIQPTIEGEAPDDNTLSGTAVGAAIPLGLRTLTNVAGKAYRAITGAVPEEAAKVIKYAEKEGVPLTTSDLLPPTTFPGKMAQGIGEKVPLVGTAGLRAEQQAARVAQIKKLSDEYGTPSDGEIFDSLKRKASTLKKAAGDRYQSTITAMGDEPIPLNNTVRAIDEQIKKYSQAGAVIPKKIIASLQQFKDDITSGDNSLELLRQNRTLFRELIKGDDQIISDTAQRVNDSVYKAMTMDMTAGVSSKLGLKAAQALRQVDGIWAREAQELKNTKLKNIFSKGEITPEIANKMLFNSNKSEANILFGSLDTAGRNNARAALLAKAVNKAEESPEKFKTEMKKLKIQTDVFFRGEDAKQLNGLLNYLQRTEQAGKAAVTAPNGQQLFQLGIPAGLLADYTLTGGVGTAGFAGIAGLARVYESKPVRDILLRLSSIRQGSTEFEQLASAFEREVQKAVTRAATTQNQEEARP